MKDIQFVTKSKPQLAVSQLWGDWFFVIFRIVRFVFEAMGFRLYYSDNSDLTRAGK